MKNSAITVMYPTLSKLIVPNGGKTDPRLQKVESNISFDFEYEAILNIFLYM